MRHDELYVADLVDSTRAVREYLDGISRKQWDDDRVLRDAVPAGPVNPGLLPRPGRSDRQRRWAPQNLGPADSPGALPQSFAVLRRSYLLVRRSVGMVVKAVTMPPADFGMAIWRQPGRRERRTG
jgi:hypothetical protein